MFKFITTLFTKCGRLKNILKYIYLALVAAKAAVSALQNTFSENNSKYKTITTILKYLSIGLTSIETVMDWLGVTVSDDERAATVDAGELEAALCAAIHNQPEVKVVKPKQKKQKSKKSTSKRKRIKQ